MAERRQGPATHHSTSVAECYTGACIGGLCFAAGHLRALERARRLSAASSDPPAERFAAPAGKIGIGFTRRRCPGLTADPVASARALPRPAADHHRIHEAAATTCRRPRARLVAAETVGVAAAPGRLLRHVGRGSSPRSTVTPPPAVGPEPRLTSTPAASPAPIRKVKSASAPSSAVLGIVVSRFIGPFGQGPVSGPTLPAGKRFTWGMLGLSTRLW